MWKTVPCGEFPVAPVSASNAASRVFATVELAGKTTNEVFAAIGHNETSNGSGYNFPFWPVENGTRVYRFNCGYFGWRFNPKLGASGTVTEVERKWIHQRRLSVSIERGVVNWNLGCAPKLGKAEGDRLLADADSLRAQEARPFMGPGGSGGWGCSV